MHFRGLWIFLGIIYIALILTGSLLRLPDMTVPFSFVDKIIHFLMYFFLVGWFIQLYHKLKSRLIILSSAILLGMGIEYLQGMTDYRSFDYFDGVANAMGASGAFLLARTKFDSILSHADRWVYQSIKF